MISQVIRDKHKALIWAQTPAVLEKLYAVLDRILHIDVVVIYAGQPQAERNEVQRLFNEDPNRAMVLITTYGAAGLGTNFQKLCYHVHFFEQSLSQSLQDQALTRARRLGNPSKVVYVFEYYIEGTICSQQVVRNLEKCIPEAAANLNNEYSESVTGVTVGDWVLHNNRLVPAADPTVASLGLEPLRADDFIRYVLDEKKGEKVTVQ